MAARPQHANILVEAKDMWKLTTIKDPFLHEFFAMQGPVFSTRKEQSDGKALAFKDLSFQEQVEWHSFSTLSALGELDGPCTVGDVMKDIQVFTTTRAMEPPSHAVPTATVPPGTDWEAYEDASCPYISQAWTDNKHHQQITALIVDAAKRMQYHSKHEPASFSGQLFRHFDYQGISPWIDGSVGRNTTLSAPPELLYEQHQDQEEKDMIRLASRLRWERHARVVQPRQERIQGRRRTARVVKAAVALNSVG